MKMSDAEWQWDRCKLTLYFTAEKRVDFRNLVRDLASPTEAAWRWLVSAQVAFGPRRPPAQLLRYYQTARLDRFKSVSSVQLMVIPDRAKIGSLMNFVGLPIFVRHFLPCPRL